MMQRSDPPGWINRARRWFIVLLAGAVSLGPYAHVAIHEADEPCEFAAASDRPRLVAACDGPCGDPSHHHHGPRHDHNKCPACLLKHSHFIAGGAPAFAAPLDPASAGELDRGSAPASSRQYRIDPQRGPPRG